MVLPAPHAHYASELTKLAHLLRVASRTLRLIASVDVSDATQIQRIADRLDEVAGDVNNLVTGRLMEAPPGH